MNTEGFRLIIEKINQIAGRDIVRMENGKIFHHINEEPRIHWHEEHYFRDSYATISKKYGKSVKLKMNDSEELKVNGADELPMRFMIHMASMSFLFYLVDKFKTQPEEERREIEMRWENELIKLLQQEKKVVELDDEMLCELCSRRIKIGREWIIEHDSTKIKIISALCLPHMDYIIDDRVVNLGQLLHARLLV